MLKQLIPRAIVVGMGALALIACSGGPEMVVAPQRNSPSPPPPAPTVLSDVTGAPTPGQSGMQGSGTAIEVELLDLGGGSPGYEFSPNNFNFSVGETVTFTLLAQGEYHTFTVDELDMDVSVNAGETESVTLTFERAGTFELICIPHQFLGMVGTITIR